ncbi:CS domain-containing protein [Cryptosporidium sp. chipmunk genotype I]|uniref:CS domain-containing protein n=1 Tax=Cryptosporidium sp. chipmunk genotype I TaxID=1280935 RepID=UPI00351A9B3F|nr:CS domain-containing protein [Cryptosporidium sp. chipmunk genotype I]
MKATRAPCFDNIGRLKYTWEQNLDEVILYFTAENMYFNQEKVMKCTNKVNKEDLHIKITCNRLTIQNKSTNYVIFDDAIFDTVDTSESLWYIENNELIIQLSKMRKGSVWKSVIKSDESSLNPIDIENMKKQMMLERFQRENPGFDFSNAEFNGNIPDPRKFMGGIRKY